MARMSAGREFTILIAEDNDVHARLIEQNLVKAGLRNRMERFVDGKAVLDFLFRHNRAAGTPCVVLLDMQLPEVGGLEVLRQIKGDPELRKTPVIVFTGTEDAQEVKRCHDMGCNSYIVKPADGARFAEAVRGLGLYISLIQVPDVGPVK
jgi:CheY-like chemotaxis protein